MPRPRFLRLDDKKAAHILDVAALHFAADGYEGASLNRILAEAGISKGACYYYFDDKADLFATVVERAWEQVAATVAFDPQGLDVQTFWPALERLYVQQIRSFAHRPWVWRVAKASSVLLENPQVGPVLLKRFAPLLALFQAIAEQGMAAGCVRTDLPAELLFAILQGLDDAIDSWLLAHPEHLLGDEGEALARKTFSVLRAVLEPPTVKESVHV